MTRDEKKFFDKALIAAMSAIVAKLPLRETDALDEEFAKVARGAEAYASELLNVRRNYD